MRAWWIDPAARGRHRQGLAVVAVARRRWDVAQCGDAAHLDETEPAWSILYSLGRREFYAIAMWCCDVPLMVHADHPARLCWLMRDAELHPLSHAVAGYAGRRGPYRRRAAA